MLTYPPDSLPPIICPMEEDAIPSKSFCSAPPHSDPQPPILPLFSVTPSIEDDGRPSKRRSGRIQGFKEPRQKRQSHKDNVAAQRPSRRTPSSTDRARENNMVPVSQSVSVKLFRADAAPTQQPRQNQDSLDLDVDTECPTIQKTQTDTRRKATPSTTQNVEKQPIVNSERDLDTNQSAMFDDGERVAGRAAETSSSVKRWVIGPLFQSFKSKMASFTEIVMSPVRLFKPPPPPPSCDHPDEVDQSEPPAAGTSSDELTEAGEDLDVQGQMENGSEDSEAVTESENWHISCTNIGSKQKNQADHLTGYSAQLKLSETGILRKSLEIAVDKHPVVQEFMFDVDLSSQGSVQGVKCELTSEETNANSVPLQRSPLLRDSFEEGSELTKSSLTTTSSLSLHPSDQTLGEEQNVKMGGAQLKRSRQKCIGNRSSSQKVSSKTLPSDISTATSEQDGSCRLPVEMAESEPSDEQFSQINITEKVSSLFDNERTLSLPSSVCYTPPGTLCQADNSGKRDNGLSVRKSAWNTSRGIAVDESLASSAPDPELVEKQQGEWQGEQDTVLESTLRVGKAKRRLQLASRADSEADLAKRKRPLRADKDGRKTGVRSDRGALTDLKRSKNEVVPRDAVIDMETALKPAGTKVPVSNGVRGRGGQKRWATINESIIHMETEKPPGTTTASSPDRCIGASENSQDGGSDRGNTSGSNKRPKRITAFNCGEPDKNVHNMNVETTVITTLIKEVKEEQLTEFIVQPLDAIRVRSQLAPKAQQKSLCKKRDISPMLDVELSKSSTKAMKLDKKPLKRKPRRQEISTSELGDILDSNSSDLLVEMLEAGLQEVRRETGQSQPTDRPRKKVRASPGSDGTAVAEDSCQGYKTTVTEGHFEEDEAESSSVQPEPVEDECKATPSRLYPECYVHLNSHTVKHIIANCKKETTTVSLADETIPTDFESTSHGQNKTTDEVLNGEQEKEEPCVDGVGIGINEPGLRHITRRLKNRRAESQRRKCRLIVGIRLEDEVAEETITGEDMDLSIAESVSSEDNSLSQSLLRSYSCPDILSLLHRDVPWGSALPSLQHVRVHESHQHQAPHIPPIHHAHKSATRTRRHTVSSVEMEREIAPLCLRKEVYPARRAASYGGSSCHLSPSTLLSPATSLSALASRFLLSPLAFLSKKLEQRGAASSSSSVCSHVSSPGVFLSTPPSWLPFAGFHPKADASTTTESVLCSSLSQVPSECESETGSRQQSEEEEDREDTSCSSQECESETRQQSEDDEDGTSCSSQECESETRQQSEEDEDGTSCSSQEFEDLGMREEKSLSDSEFKVVIKHEERGKVSSIRIRKALPKAQNNLTPMGLPKAIRVKKKLFSLEEIYTNKNFAKPPEGRLETIFELPLSRRNGSESHFGHRRVKRVVEFPEVGVVRKPKKSLAGAGKAGATSVPGGRPRRGGYLSSKEEPPISMQELDSLLCTKLAQLDLWLTSDQESC